MPRLDNGNDEVIRAFGLDYKEEDPGETGPVDVCSNCYIVHGWDHKTSVLILDHPSYEDDYYTCAHCKARLSYDDD